MDKWSSIDVLFYDTSAIKVYGIEWNKIKCSQNMPYEVRKEAETADHTHIPSAEHAHKSWYAENEQMRLTFCLRYMTTIQLHFISTRRINITSHYVTWCWFASNGVITVTLHYSIDVTLCRTVQSYFLVWLRRENRRRMALITRAKGFLCLFSASAEVSSLPGAVCCSWPETDSVRLAAGWFFIIWLSRTSIGWVSSVFRS